jgi:hypothetical protein
MASYAYFYQAGGWNQNARFALVRAILESGTLQIDAYQLHTGDRAVWNGHYYLDKAPGASLMVVPPVAVARVISRVFGVSPLTFPGIAWTSYAATVVSSGVFTTIAALTIYFLALRWGYSRGAGIFAATAYGLAGPAWAYATLFMGHAVAAGCLMLALWAAFDLERPESRWRSMSVLLGLSLGWAVVTELQTAVPAVVVLGVALGRAWRARRADFWPIALWTCAAGGLCAVILLGYNFLAFGSPFHLGYSSEEHFAEMRTGFFGITTPEWWRVRELLIGSYRGLLPLWPLAAVMPIGLAILAVDGQRRAAALVALFVCVYYLVLNASYFYWEGGWAYGPRQLVTAFPFAALGLLPLWDARWKILRIALVAAYAWGLAITLVAVSTTPQPPTVFKAPVSELLWPAFRDGDLSLNHQTFVHFMATPDQLRGGQVPHASWNLGEIAGLHGLASLVPLGVIWLAAALRLRR